MHTHSVNPERNSRGALFVALPSPPSALSINVRALIGRVEKGAIRVPDFQRPLRWGNDDVVKLFDSILKGYPIGSLLFWRRAFSEGEISVGAARVRVGQVQDGWHIVDGQQRTTSLAASLLDFDQGGDSRWEVHFDAHRGGFLPAHPAESTAYQDSVLVPLRVLGSLSRLGRWLRERDLADAYVARIEQVQQRILDYDIPAYVVETEDVDALRGVFARMNSTGVRMRADEVFQALLGSGGQSARRQSIDLGQLQQVCDIDGFGQPPRDEVMKAVLAMSGLDPSKRLDELGEDAMTGLVESGDAAEALVRTVEFMRSSTDEPMPGAGIPAYAFIPYPVVFVILARWFYLFPETSESGRRSLRQWLWRGVATGVHQRGAMSAMRLQVRQIQDGDLGGSLSALLDAVGDPPKIDWSLDPFHANHAASRVELLALLARGPKSQLGEVSWRSLLSQGERVAREIFSVTGMEGPLRKLARTAANRALLDTRPTHLVTEFRKWKWETHGEALASHLLDREDLEALVAGDRESVLRRRAERVRNLVTRFLSQRAGVGEPLVLPFEAYVEGRQSG